MRLSALVKIGRRLLPKACLLLAVSCASQPDLIGIPDPNAENGAVPGASRHTIYIATTRQPSATPGEFFSSRRAQSLGLAAVTVSLPPNRRAGEIQRPTTLPPDASREFMVVDPLVFASGSDFVGGLNEELARRAEGDRDVLLFVHGFNNTLSDSVLRVAQFVEDSGFRGVPVLFSWASAGRISDYAYDLNSVLAARPLVEDASALIIQSNANGFDVFAHSMGTLLVTEVMVQSALQGSLGSSGRLRNIVFAAPDIDVDVFRSQLSQIAEVPGSLFVLVSNDDRALGVSRQIAGGIDRVGAADADELAGLGITVIELNNIDDSRSGSHSKFAGSPEVVQLVGRTLQQHGYPQHQTETLVFDALELLPNTLEALAPQ